MDSFSTLQLTPVDYFVLVIVLVSALVGISRGLFKEVLSLASWFIAAWVSYRYASYLATEWLSTFHMDELISLGVSFLILFVLTMIACGLAGGVIQKIIDSAGLSLTDRFLGLVFGIFRGGFIVVVLATLAVLTPIPQSPAWQKALTRPTLEMATGFIKNWLPKDWAKQLAAAMTTVTPTASPSLKIGI
jgi:membrane protein required for colicin V production